MIKTADILNARILIVDDLAPNVALLDQMLEGAGYSGVTSTHDPYEVCALHRKNHYDLILLDLHMPGMDGFEVLEGLKKVETDGYPPVLAITAQPDHKLRALKAGAKDFISKPFELAEVLLRVRNMLEIRRLHRNETVLNHRRLENSQRIAGLGDWDYEFATHQLVWSDEVYRILGLPRQDFPSSSETFYRQVHPDDLAFVREKKKMVAEGLQRVEFEHRIIRLDGAVRNIHQIAEIVFDRQGQPIRESGTIQDVTDQKLADAAMRESEERYRKMVMLSPDAHFVHVDGRITFVNRAFCQLMGADDPTHYLHQVALEVVHPDSRELVRELERKIFNDQPVAPTEMKFLRLDGTAVDVEVSGVAFDFRGHQEVQVSARNISSRKKADEELRGKTALFEAQIHSSPDGIIVLDPQHRKIIQNRRFVEMMKLPPELADHDDAPGRLAHTADLMQDGDAMIARVYHIYSHPEAASRDELVLKDGTVLDRYSSPILGEQGRNYGRIWAFRDITANKAAEVALRESEERFKFVARAVSDVVWDWNLVTNTLWWNDGFLTTFGFKAGEINSSVEFWTERIHPEDRSRVVQGLNEAVLGRTESWNAEYRFQRKDGTHAFVQDRGYILRNEAGRGVRMVGGMRDLTEQKKMEAQYLRAQRMESIGTLAGGIAHDLNNILAPIMMSVELLKLEAGDDPRRRKILDAIHVSSRRGADLVRQVLSFARGLDGERSVLRIGPLVSDLDAIISETFPRGIRIVTEVPADLWPVIGDPTQLHQVLLNLAVNARDAMPKGGTLTLTAENVMIDAQYASTSRETKAGSYILVQVTDTGMGIPPAVRERIFEPFFTTKEFGKGSGIGLTTVHTIIKSHNGFLKVESEENRGTTFKIYLPAEPTAPAADLAPAVPGNAARGRNELVLVVDDEVSIRDITRQTLETYGYRVITASDGAEAVALYAQQAQDVALVMTDMMMPFMDGTATIQVLMRINPDVRIIAASGLTVAENVAKALEAGARDFLPKPFTAGTLRKMIREVIDRPLFPLVR
jgi:PAS domain S-box-containing protein